MKKRTSFCPSIMLIFVILMNSILCHSETQQKAETEGELKEILKTCAGYCERLSEASIHFVCREKIAEEVYHYWPGTYFRHQPLRFDKERSTFVYEFRFSLEGMRIQECRDLVEENGEKKYEESALLKTMHYGQEIIFLEPVSLLSEDCQAYYRYKILGREGFKGEKAVSIEVVPLDEEADDFTAKIWVRDSDFSLLKIERVQKAIGDFEGFKKTSDGVPLEPHITCITEFLYEKDGISFPTRHSIREAYYAIFSKRKRLVKSLIRSETIVVYEDYKVETIEIK
jgi:hypothetical protein